MTRQSAQKGWATRRAQQWAREKWEAEQRAADPGPQPVDHGRAVVAAMRAAGWTEDEVAAAIRAVFDMRASRG